MKPSRSRWSTSSAGYLGRKYHFAKYGPEGRPALPPLRMVVRAPFTDADNRQLILDHEAFRRMSAPSIRNATGREIHRFERMWRGFLFSIHIGQDHKHIRARDDVA